MGLWWAVLGAAVLRLLRSSAAAAGAAGRSFESSAADNFLGTPQGTEQLLVVGLPETAGESV